MEVYECVSREEALRDLARTLVGARWIDATMALAPDQKHAAGCVDQNLLRVQGRDDLLVFRHTAAGRHSSRVGLACSCKEEERPP